MTERLKDLMHERASAPDFALPDVDALVASGTRRRRRRQAGLAALAVAAVAVPVVALAGTIGGDSATDEPPVASTPVDTGAYPRGPVTWAAGSTIHYGDLQLDAGHPISAFVQTSAGFAVVSDGDVYAVDGTGSQQVGQVGDGKPQLVADEDGTTVAWVQRGSDEPSVGVYDLAEQVTSGLTAPPGSDDLQVYALDDTTLYARDARGVVALDTTSGRSRTLLDDPSDTFDISDARSATVAFTLSATDGLRVGEVPDARVLSTRLPHRGELSPDGTLFAPDDDALTVVESDSGRDFTPYLEGFDSARTYAWLDDDTVAVEAVRDAASGTVTLLGCAISTSVCEVDVPEAGAADDVVLPTGEPS